MAHKANPTLGLASLQVQQEMGTKTLRCSVAQFLEVHTSGCPWGWGWSSLWVTISP